MRSSLQQAVLFALASVLKPVVKLLLQTGVGYAEFCGVAKSVFVAVATEDYGLRRRPTNISRVSAMTGISRKEVSRLKHEGDVERWTPSLEASPANSVLHHWHHDPDFASSPGVPKALAFDGPGSFATLVSRYAGDIPPGAIRASLRQAGAVNDVGGGLLAPRDRFFVPAQLDEDVIRGMFFSLANLAGTIAHNAHTRRDHGPSSSAHIEELFLERAAWTDHISGSGAEMFKTWAREEATRFIEAADHRLGEYELPRRQWRKANQRLVGIGVYYFEEPKRR
jgi:hypothetical protein